VSIERSTLSVCFCPQGIDDEFLPKCVTLPHYRLAPFLKAYQEACLVAQQNAETFKNDNDILLERTIAIVRPKSLIPVKIALIVVSYNNAPYIWVRKFWYDRCLTEESKEEFLPWPNPSKDGGLYKPCRGGFRLSSQLDAFESLKTFFKKHVSLDSPSVHE